ncbi:hypothetical protein COC42_01880 [Sphingomonas spermidinifaciens]|uniref:Uncharacterized protein n=1 Tax=Sphingomonas spermidinifaciens TaxID=1141889 RepID=A0A2A4B6D0_9SPHN|nr:hypothetical protein [Sphingomonas spermidinifaciens]PCD03196.1 hypothetical protein COC42_01880 [Sphingomonas spermidinifaciens]
MTIDRIHTGPLGPIDPAGRDGRSPASVGEASVRSVALAVVGRIVDELGIGVGGRAPAADPYRLREVADMATRAFPGSAPAAEGELMRAIEALAGTIAAHMAARVDGSTLERVDDALAGQAPAREGVEGVTEFLDQVTIRLEASR